MELFFLSYEILTILFVVALLAGLLDTLAGGGGLISLPALLMTGMSPLAALGTNKLQGSMGTATATITLIKQGYLHWHEIKWLMLYAFIGAALGAMIIQLVNLQSIDWLIPIVLGVIGVYFLTAPATITHPKVEDPSNQPRLTKLYHRLTTPLIGGYDGMFGPGTGAFFTLAGVAQRNEELTEATAKAKALNFSTNVASLIVFLSVGQLHWQAGLLMMIGQMLGAWIGAKSLVKINPKHLKFLIVLVSFSMLLKYVYALE